MAVEYAGQGDARRTWPFRADLLSAAATASERPPAWQMTPGVAAGDVMLPFFVTPYPNGDLLVSFRYAAYHWPGVAGVARVGQDGRPLWFAVDGYSHHEGVVAAGDTVWIPGHLFPGPRVDVPSLEDHQWMCRRSVRMDRVNVLDENGALVDSVSVVDAFLRSRWAPVMRDARPCDPFHLNSVALVGEDVSGLPGVRPGDLVLSLRNLDAFAIVDREARVVTRYVQGTFEAQHSVKHLGGSRFVLLDNRGGDIQRDGVWRKYSRVLVLDLADGSETVVFPKNPGQDPLCCIYSYFQGQISISPDRMRVIASFSQAGKAVEVRIADGRALAEFNFVHDMRRFGRSLPTATVRFLDGQVFYARER